LDTISNALYLVETNFYSSTLFALVVFFHFLPDLVLLHRMHAVGALFPAFHIPRPAFMTDGTLFWLGLDGKGYPTWYGARLTYTFERHDTLFKVMSFWFVWLACAAVQLGCTLLYAFLHLPYLMVHVPFWCLWLLVGLYCYNIKAMAIGKVWSAWFRVWLNSDRMDSPILVDTEIMNQGIFVHFVFETVPQIFLQTINNQLTASWGGLAIFSTVFSIFMVVNGCYRYLYYVVFLRTKFEDIPLEITIGFTTLTLEKATHQFKPPAPSAAHAKDEHFIFTDVYPESGEEAIPGEGEDQVREIEMTADFIPSGESGAAAASPAAFMSSFFQPAGKTVVRPSSVVQGEEFQSLLSAMDGRINSMDGRVSTLESKSEDIFKVLTAKIDEIRKNQALS
jgi:hypothetical protein